jgi:hypothetical protein
VLRGGDTPRDGPERLTFAQLCIDNRLYAAAARLFAEALEADPKLGDDRQAQHRYIAAGAAALAIALKGKDDPPPDEVARTNLRRQALAWLRAERAAWAKLLESGPPQARPVIAQTVRHWQEDTALAGLRDRDALDKLPVEEQEAWRALWADVEALLKQTDGARR